MLRVVTQGSTTKVDVVEYSCSKGKIEVNTIGGITQSNKNIMLGEYESPSRAKEIFLSMVNAEEQNKIFFKPDKIIRMTDEKNNRYHGRKNKSYGGS